MILCQFHDTTDASDIYDARPISLHILRAFGQKTKESSGHKKYRRQIDGSVTAPIFKWVAIAVPRDSAVLFSGASLSLRKGEVGLSCPALDVR